MVPYSASNSSTIAVASAVGAMNTTAAWRRPARRLRANTSPLSVTSLRISRSSQQPDNGQLREHDPGDRDRQRERDIARQSIAGERGPSAVDDDAHRIQTGDVGETGRGHGG